LLLISHWLFNCSYSDSGYLSGLPEVWLEEVGDIAGTGVALDTMEPGKKYITAVLNSTSKVKPGG